MSLDNLLSIIKYYSNTVKNSKLKLNSKLIGDGQSDSIEIKNIMNLLEIISINVWKCFHITYALHPYSPRALEEMKLFFMNNNVLPVLTSDGQQSFEFVTSTGLILNSDEDVDDNVKLKLKLKLNLKGDGDGDGVMEGVHNDNNGNTGKMNDTDNVDKTDDIDNTDNDDNINKNVNDNIDNISSKIDSKNNPKIYPKIKKLIAVDDITLFNLFQPDFNEEVLDDICFINGCSSTREKLLSEYETENIDYNTEIMRNDCHNLINSESNIFNNNVRTPPFKTFYAPKTTLALFKFLDIPCLSKLIKSSIKKEEKKDEKNEEISMSMIKNSKNSKNTKNFTPTNLCIFVKKCLNVLFEIAQRMLFMEDRIYLCTNLTPYFLSIFSMRIRECSVLEREMSLDLFSLGIVFENERTHSQSMPFYKESGSGSGSGSGGGSRSEERRVGKEC